MLQTQATTRRKDVFVAQSKAGNLWPLQSSISHGRTWTYQYWKSEKSGRSPLLLRLVNGQVVPGPDPPTLSRTVAFSAFDFCREEEPFGSPSRRTGACDEGKIDDLVRGLLVAVDQKGSVICVDLAGQKYWLVTRSGVSATAVCVAPVRRREVIVALSNGSIRCYNIDSQSLIAKLPVCHRRPPHHICTHPSRPQFLTTSTTEAIIWDANSWSRIRVLAGANHVGVHQAMFSPKGDLVLASFHDDTLLVWDGETFAQIWKIALPNSVTSPSPAQGTENGDYSDDSEDLVGTAVTGHRMEVFSVSRDGEILAAGGRSSRLYLWDISDRTLTQEVAISKIEGGVKAIEFMGNTKTLALLTADGQILLLDTIASSFLHRLDQLSDIDRFSLSPDGRTMATLSRSTRANIEIWSLEGLLRRHVTRPPVVPDKNENSLPRTPSSLRRSLMRSPSLDVEAESSRSFDPFSRSGDDRPDIHIPRYQDGEPVVGDEEREASNAEDRRARETLKAAEDSFLHIVNGLGKPSVRERPKDGTKDEKDVSGSIVRPIGRDHPLSMKPPPLSLYDIVDVTEKHTMLDAKKLRKYLHHFGGFPEKHRTLIWRYLLQLPENRTAYQLLLDKGLHPCLEHFHELFPLKSYRILKSMERILSALANWAPIFEKMDSVPAMIFPFIKVYGNDTFACFETIVTVAVNWCQKWWEYYPNPPVEALDLLEDLLSYHDPELLNHFVRCQVTSQIYGWSIMQTLFSEVFSRAEWVRVWDHFFMEPPSFLYYVLASYMHINRTALLGVERIEDFKFFFVHQNPVNVDHLLYTAYRLRSVTPTVTSPAGSVDPFRPLPRGQYPVFNKYPKFVVNYQHKLREKIREEEEEYVKARMTD